MTLATTGPTSSGVASNISAATKLDAPAPTATKTGFDCDLITLAKARSRGVEEAARRLTQMAAEMKARDPMGAKFGPLGSKAVRSVLSAQRG